MDLEQQLPDRRVSIDITHSLKPVLLLKHKVLALAYPGHEVVMLLGTLRG